jgi:hypothetical protein
MSPGAERSQNAQLTRVARGTVSARQFFAGFDADIELLGFVTATVMRHDYVQHIAASALDGVEIDPALTPESLAR